MRWTDSPTYRLCIISDAYDTPLRFPENRAGTSSIVSLSDRSRFHLIDSELHARHFPFFPFISFPTPASSSPDSPLCP